MVTARKTTRPRKAAPRKTAVKKTVPAKPVKKSSVVSKADLEKRLAELRKEIIDTVEEYTDDGTLCDSERRNIEDRFSGLGVEFPKKVKAVELKYQIVITCPAMPYVDAGWGTEIAEDAVEQERIEKAILDASLPPGCHMVTIDLEDYEFDRH